MKTTLLYFLAAVILAAAILYHASIPDPPAPATGQVTLEQILSVKELHLVRHEYNDLFFLHRRNDASRPVRAIAQVPVTVTAYINLKEMRFESSGDTVRAILLPHARLKSPEYRLDQLVLRDTRTLAVHVGRGIYPMVAEGLRLHVAKRSDSLQQVAVRNHILTQTESEGKAWMEWFLKTVGRGDIRVLISD